MAEKDLHYTPLDRSKLHPKKRPLLLTSKTLGGLILFLIIGVGMLAYLLVLQKPIPRRVPAYVSGEASACNIKLGPPISGSEKIDGNKYSIQIPVENKSDGKKRIRINSGWYSCPFNDKQTCTQGDSHSKEEEILLRSKEQKIITVTAEQPEGTCGSLQIDLKLKAVKKADDDDDGKKEGEKKEGEKKEGEKSESNIKGESDDGSRWDEGCNTNSTWVGGFYSFPQACGVVPTNTPPPSSPTPTPTPTGVAPTITPKPTDDDDVPPTVTPKATKTPTPTLTPTLSESTPTSTPKVTATIEVTPTVTTVDNSPTPSPTSDSTVSNPTATSNPTQSANTPTPTEIVLVKATATPGQEVTTAAQVSEIPPAGSATFGLIFAVISFAVIFVGLLL